MPALDGAELETFLDSLARLLAARLPEAEVRRQMETADGFDRALWSEMAALGVAGLLVPEAQGGSGAGAVAMERAMEIAGRHLYAGPLLSSAVLAATLVEALGDADARERLLPGIADGSRIATVALTGPAARWTADTVAVTATPAGNGWRLSGKAAFVTHGAQADTLLVVARDPHGHGVFEVAAGAEGVAVTALPAFDRTLRLADLDLVAVAASRIGSGDAWPAVERALAMGQVAMAGEQAGAGAHVLAMTVDYARQRHQFGRAIGSFQAVKHMAAELLLESESAVSAARHAAQQVSEDEVSIHLAAFACADAYVQVAATAIQMHGGIAFTWAHPCHLYLRRARALAELLGSPDDARERYLACLEAAA